MTRRIVPIFGGISVLLVTVLAIGMALPSSWEAEQTVDLPHAAADLFPLLEDLAAWDAWTVWSEFESIVSDPSRGVGATRSWDDRNYGAGQIRLTEVREGLRVSYRVELDGGTWVEGEISLAEHHGGTEVTWKESGDFGWNPLMGYWARRLPESQKAQMLDSLIRLGKALDEGGAGEG